MSACRKYEAQLEDYFEGKLEAAQAAEVDAHLRSCAACREAVEVAREASGLLRAAIAPAPDPGAAFWANLRTAIALAEAERESASLRAEDFWRSLEFLARRFAWSTALAVVVLTGYLAGFDAIHEERNGSAQAEIREVFAEPVNVPANNEEVLLTLVSRENGR